MEVIWANRKKLIESESVFVLFLNSRTGSSFGSKASSFAAGAVGGIAAYSIMRSLSGSHRYRSEGYYGPGYGGQ